MSKLVFCKFVACFACGNYFVIFGCVFLEFRAGPERAALELSGGEILLSVWGWV
jgi:hypothetical protein